MAQKVRDYAFGITVYYGKETYCNWFKYRTNQPELVRNAIKSYINSVKVDTDEYQYDVRLRLAKNVHCTIIEGLKLEDIMSHWRIGDFVNETHLVEEEGLILVDYMTSNQDWDWKKEQTSQTNTFFNKDINPWLLTLLKENFDVHTACNGNYYVRGNISVYKEYDESLERYAYSIARSVKTVKKVTEEVFRVFR